jgi:predicted nucleotidyltransferase
MAAQPQQSETEPAPEAGRELLRAVDQAFGSKCKAAWLSGSFAYQGARRSRSDIDVVVVLDESAPLPADAATMSLIRRFVDAYLEVHARHGFDPDLDFPGEFVTPAMLDEAIEWRSLDVDGGVPTRFPPVDTDDYWLGRPDRWYNAWISMTAFSRFPIGDRDYHSAVKLAAWKTIVRFLLLRGERRRLTPDEMLLGLDQFGVKPRYPEFWAVERERVERVLDALQAEGAVALADGLIEPNMDRLGEWERRLEAAIGAGAAPPPLLLDVGRHREIEEYAASRWETLTGERV